MTDEIAPPAWRLPTGVNPSLWHYTHTPRLAAEEDEFFAGHALHEADARALSTRFTSPGPLVDLGCGVGRHALTFATRGFEVTAVDLSQAMLRVVGAKAEAAGVRLRRVRANLCDLGSLPDGSFDYALSMFSTLGMIRGDRPRRQAVRETFRVLRPGGRLAIHVHNLWLNLGDRYGRRWLLGYLPRELFRGGRPEPDDQRMIYRGIPDMEVHMFRWGKFRRLLTDAGFRVDEVLPIDAVTAKPIRFPRLLHPVRAGGWIVFASKPGGKNVRTEETL